MLSVGRNAQRRTEEIFLEKQFLNGTTQGNANEKLNIRIQIQIQIQPQSTMQMNVEK